MTTRPSSVRRDLDMLAVLAQYGRTMLAVQQFEVSLALLAHLTSDDLGKMRKVTKRSMLVVIRRQIHLFQRASASELRNELKGRIEADLIDKISRAIKYRDVLAHRYLRERVRSDDERLFKNGTHDELIRLAVMFSELDQELATVWKALLHQRSESMDTSAMPHGWEDAWEQAARTIIYGSAWTEEEDELLAAPSSRLSYSSSTVWLRAAEPRQRQSRRPSRPR